jgi:predicted ATPase/class 3 adenylate cyclase
MAVEGRTYTFLFTDIEGSSARWEAHPEQMSAAIERHNRIVREGVLAHGGRVFKSLGDGLAAVFDVPHGAVLAAFEIQEALTKAEWGEPGPVRIRIGVHTGFAEVIEDDFGGAAINRVARITNLGHGGQTLISQTTRDLSADLLPASIVCTSLGNVTLAGHTRDETVFQIGPGDFPPRRRLEAKHNLAELDRPFVGRVEERARLNRNLAAGDQRLITVLGFGGMGKTTLARICAEDCLDSFPDGVWWVECETLRSREQLVAAVGAILDEPLDPRDAERSLVEAVGDRRMLLVLDCFENLVLQAGAVDALLKGCPNLQILVTSRVVLGIGWENEFELRGLGGGKRKGSLPDGIALFTEAAKRVRPDFAVRRANRKAVQELVGDLECIPLAIVLAAGRLRHLSLDEIGRQVKASLLATVRSVHLSEGRHATLRRVIETSFSLLPEEDRRVLGELSVFEGGFFLSDAEAVLGSPGVMNAISRLRDHSLLHADHRSEGMRYRELDSVREYLDEVIGEDSLRALRLAHARHYVVVAERIRGAFDRGDWKESAMLLQLEAANMRQAVETTIGQSDDSLSADYARLLARVYLESGWMTDFERLATHAISRYRAIAPELHGLLGIAARRAGDSQSAIRHWESRLSIFQEGGDVGGQADALGDLINLSLELDDRDGVLRQMARYEGLHASLEGSSRIEHEMLLARCAAFLGDFEKACLMADQIASCLPARADSWLLYVRRTLSEVYRQAGREQESIQAATETIALSLEGGYVDRCAEALAQLARTFLHFDRKAEAEKVLSALSGMPKRSVAARRSSGLRLEFSRRYGFEPRPLEGSWQDAAAHFQKSRIF